MIRGVILVKKGDLEGVQGRTKSLSTFHCAVQD